MRDLGAFSQTLMLSAYGRGIGSMPAYEIVKYPELVRQFIEIPDDQTITMGVALGYPDEKYSVYIFSFFA
ncbi:MAG: nitroreductase family protein [Bacillota bacterium]|nr:nitroreductase family protein [Bacillota bacterium]